MERKFEIEQGRQVIRCSRCRAVESMTATGGTGGRRLPPDAVGRHFAQKGWRIGATPRKDRCPMCAGRAPKPKMEEPQMRGKIAEQAAMPKEPNLRPGASEQPPREMGREDRQIVFAKLTETYGGEKVGYSPGWNDTRVAADLNCPRAWVTNVRDEFFGPPAPAESEEIIEIKNEIGKLIAEHTTQVLTMAPLRREAKEIADQIGALTMRSDKLVSEVDARTAALKVIGTTITELQVSVRRLRGGSL